MYCIYTDQLNFDIIVAIVILLKKFENVSYSSMEEFLKSEETPDKILILSEKFNYENISKIKTSKIHVFTKTKLTEKEELLVKETENVMVYYNENYSFAKYVSIKYIFSFPTDAIKLFFMRLDKILSSGENDDYPYLSAIENIVMREEGLGEKVRVFNSIYGGFLSNPDSSIEKYKALNKRLSDSEKKKEIENAKRNLYNDLIDSDFFGEYSSFGKQFYFLQVPQTFTEEEMKITHSRFFADYSSDGIVVTYKETKKGFYAKITSTEETGNLYEIIGEPEEGQKSIEVDGGTFYPSCSRDKIKCYSGVAYITDMDDFFPMDDEDSDEDEN